MPKAHTHICKHFLCYDATNGAKINQVNTCNLADSRLFLMLNFDLMIILRASPTRERPPPDAVADEALQQLKPWSHELLLNAHGKLLLDGNSLPYNLTFSYTLFQISYSASQLIHKFWTWWSFTGKHLQAVSRIWLKDCRYMFVFGVPVEDWSCFWLWMHVKRHWCCLMLKINIYLILRYTGSAATIESTIST